MFCSSSLFHSAQSRFKRLGWLLLILTIITNCETASASDVAFFYALDADLKAFKDQAGSEDQSTKVLDRTVQRFELGQRRICAVKMGSGAVETAISATALLARFHCVMAFSVGPVGALDDHIATKSWHAVGKVISYQKGSWQQTGFQNAVSSHETVDAFDNLQNNRNPVNFSFELPQLFLTPTALESVAVASGEMFVSSSSYREQLHGQTDAQVVDMNLFGLTAACSAAKVPLWSWRIISDRSDDNATVDFRSFVASYDGAGGRAIAEIIRRLPPDPLSPDTYPEIKRLLERPTPQTPAPSPSR